MNINDNEENCDDDEEINRQGLGMPRLIHEGWPMVHVCGKDAELYEAIGNGKVNDVWHLLEGNRQLVFSILYDYNGTKSKWNFYDIAYQFHVKNLEGSKDYENYETIYSMVAYFYRLECD